MTIHDLDRVDIQSVVDGAPRLFITDVGTIEDPNERSELYEKKLMLYGTHINTDEFREKYEGWKDSKIILVSPVEPNEQMKQFENIEIGDGSGEVFKIPIEYKHKPA